MLPSQFLVLQRHSVVCTAGCTRAGGSRSCPIGSSTLRGRSSSVRVNVDLCSQDAQAGRPFPGVARSCALPTNAPETSMPMLRFLRDALDHANQHVWLALECVAGNSVESSTSFGGCFWKHLWPALARYVEGEPKQSHQPNSRSLSLLQAPCDVQHGALRCPARCEAWCTTAFSLQRAHVNADVHFLRLGPAA